MLKQAKMPQVVKLPPQAAWGKALAAGLETDILGRPILAYDELESTNDTLKHLAMEGAPEGMTIVAASQSKGRGRMGRYWL